MDLQRMALALPVMLLGGMLQGAVGFGFGLFAVPALLTIGFPAPVALAVAAIGTAAQTATGVHRLRRVVPWRAVGVSLLYRGASLPVGVWVLHQLVGCPVAALKFWVGAVMLLLMVAQAAWQPHPRTALRAGWDATAFLASGFTAGLCGMGGPPLVLWVMAHDWPADRTRAFLFAGFMGMVPLQLAVLVLTFGGPVLHGAALGAVLIPAVVIGSLLGLRVGGRFSKPTLRSVVFLVLVATALAAMSPQVSVWVRGGAVGGGSPPRPVAAGDGGEARGASR